MSELAKKLREARELISDKSHWTQGANAKTEDGKEVPFHSSLAFKFCVAGACEKVKAVGWAFPLENAAEYLYPDYLGPRTVNDQLGHEAALALLDYAIAEVEDFG